MPVGGAVRRTIEESTAVIDRPHRTACATDEGVARETLGQHAVEAHERALGFVASQRVERIARAVERIDSVRARPEIELVATGTDHAHENPAVLLLIVRDPALLRAADRKD